MRNRPWLVVGGVIAAVVVLMVAVIALTSMRGALPSAAPSPTPTTTSATPTPTPTSSPTPSVTPPPPAPPVSARPAPSELVLTENSLSNVVLGSDPATYDPTTTIAEWTPWDCSEYGGTSSGVALMPVAEYYTPEGRTLFQASAGDSGVRAITIGDPELSTDRGARTGMSWDDVAALYPEAVDTSARGDGAVHAFDTTYGTMYFHSRDGIVNTIGISTHGPASEFRNVNYHGFYAFCL